MFNQALKTVVPHRVFFQDAAASATPPRAESRLGMLDAARGLAALYVVMHHARLLLWISPHDALVSGSRKARYMVTAASSLSFGHQAVVLFFVLSGFCIHYRRARAISEGRATPLQVGPYLYRRARRIIPPLYFALVLTAAIGALVRWVNPAAISGAFLGNPNAEPFLIQNNSLSVLLGNLIFMQSLTVPPYGNNTPLWSLAYEFHFYWMYLLFLVLRRRAGIESATGLVLLLSLGTGIALTVRPEWISGLLPVVSVWFAWVMGAFAAEVHVGCARWPAIARGKIATGILALVWLGTVSRVPWMLSDLLGGVVCAQVLLLLIRPRDASFEKISRVPWRSVAARFPAWLGAISYSLYLTHVPVLALIAAWYYTKPRPIMPFYPSLALAGVAASLAVGWLSYQLVERHCVRG
jgi:peptidoglycan/LPS O-acetylase OafA/YrhL